MSRQVFEIDTMDTCLLCLTNCDKEDVTIETETRTSIQKRQTAYKMLLRYLKIDVLKLDPFSNSFDGAETSANNVNLDVVLCDTCSEVTIEFLDLFQIFDEARLRLDEICGVLLDRISKGDADRGRLQANHKSLKSVNESLAEILRKETKQKCAERLSKSIPKLTLSRGDSFKRRKIDSSSTISKETNINSENIGEPIDFVEVNEQHDPIQEVVAPLQKNYIGSMESDVGAMISLNQIKVESEDIDLPPDSTFQEPIPPSPVEAENIPHGELMRDDHKELLMFDTVQLVDQSELEQALENHLNLNGDPLLDISYSKGPPPPPPALYPILPSTSAGLLVPISLATFPCEKCASVFITSDHLVTHQMTAHPVFTFTCSQCREMFESRALFETHITSRHPRSTSFETQLRPSTCERNLVEKVIDCFVMSKNLFSIRGKEILFDCSLCPGKNFIFPQKNKVRAHIFQEHFDMVTLEIQKRNANLSGGNSVDMEGEGEKCSCHLCCRKFIAGHSTVKLDKLSSGALVIMFECKYCEQRFSLRDKLRSHLVNDHPLIVFSGELPPGTNNEQEFNRIVDTLEGRARETFDGDLNVEVIKFQCPCCPERFAGRGFIRPHILHTHLDQVLKNLGGG